MAYAKFDDGFADHPKVRDLSDAAYRLHSAGIIHCARWLTDGHVTASVVGDLLRRSTPKRRASALQELLERGLWRELMPDALYEIHDYLDWNDSRAKVEARRRKNAERLAKWRSEHGRDDA